MAKGAQIERHQRSRQQPHDDILEAGRPIGPQPGQHQKPRHGPRRRQPRRHVPGRRQDAAQTFTETDAIEGDGNRLRQEQHQAQAAAESRPEGARNQIIIPPALDAQVGGNRGKREAGKHRNGVGQADDEQRARQPRLAHHEPQAQKKDDAQNGQQTGGEYTGKCAHGRRRRWPGNGWVGSAWHGVRVLGKLAFVRRTPRHRRHRAPEARYGASGCKTICSSGFAGKRQPRPNGPRPVRVRG
jgi:hypothetical protein